MWNPTNLYGEFFLSQNKYSPIYLPTRIQWNVRKVLNLAQMTICWGFKDGIFQRLSMLVLRITLKKLGCKNDEPNFDSTGEFNYVSIFVDSKGVTFSACVAKAWRVQLTSYPATNTWKPLKIGRVSPNANFQGGFGWLFVWDMGICWQFQILRAPRRFGWPFKTSWSETLNTSQYVPLRKIGFLMTSDVILCMFRWS